MLNNIAQIDFDINLYKFEKKKQNIDNKNKEKENKKIQINFKNSFVNEKTQYKYDKIIEHNNKRNTEKQETIIAKADSNVSVIPERNESEMIIIECCNSSYKTLLEIDTSINRTTVNEISRNEIIPNNFIEHMDLEEKDKYDYDYFSDRDEQPIIKQEEHVYPNEIELKELVVNKQHLDNFEENIEIRNEYCEIVTKESENYVNKITSDSEPLEQKKEEKNNEDKKPIILEDNDNKEPIMLYANKESIILKNHDNKELIILENKISTPETIDVIKEKEYNDEDILEDIIEDLPENVPVVIEGVKNQESNNRYITDKYDRFLEDSIATSRKNDIQLLLRQQMLNIVHDIKDKKKVNKLLLEKKKKNLIEVIKTKSTPIKEIRSVDKSDIVRTNVSNEICTKIYQKASNNIDNTYNSNTKNLDSLLKETIPSFRVPENELTFGNKILKNKLEENLYEDFIKEDIKEVIDKIDGDNVTSIHQSVKLENQKGYNIDLDEFIKENTKHDIEEEDIINLEAEALVKEEIPVYQDKRLLVFENYMDKNE
jgi:hypothetical protein